MEAKDTAEQTVKGEAVGMTAAFSLGRGLGPCGCPRCTTDPQYAAQVRTRENSVKAETPRAAAQ